MSGSATTPERLHAAFQDAFNRHDLDALAALYEPDAVLLLGGVRVQGTEAIRTAYETVLILRPIIEMRTVSATRAGDLALLRGQWTWRAAAPDGTIVSREGRNAETARRQADGRWLFVIDDPRSE